MSKEKCRAKSKQTGRRCGLYPVAGGTVCKWHGGGAPAVKAAAARKAQEEEARRPDGHPWAARSRGPV